jgi:hypothetical protein
MRAAYSATAMRIPTMLLVVALLFFSSVLQSGASRCCFSLDSVVLLAASPCVSVTPVKQAYRHRKRKQIR